VKGEPEWVSVDDALLYHAEVLAVFGGGEGLRDRGLLESALARARHVYADESDDIVVLAATYAHGIAKNHPFVDGNKRVAFVVTRIFLGMNGTRFDPPEHEAVVMFENLASGGVAMDDFTRWVRKHCQ
jgi:death on curing protein